MKSWLVLLLVAYVAWNFTDVSSSSPLQTLAAPLLLAATVIIAICKLTAALLAKGSRAQTSSDGSGTELGVNNDCGGDGGGD